VSDDRKRTGMVKVWSNYFWGLVHANVTHGDHTVVYGLDISPSPLLLLDECYPLD
jgi:hypothetical protein